MKKLKFTYIFLAAGLFLNNLSAQTYNVPEILYYKFNNGSTTTPNYAVPGQGTNPAILNNMFTTPGGQFDSALLGNAGTGTTTFTNSGWNMNVGTSNWTISLWINNFPSVTGTSYLFGNDITTSFRCFTNGAAGAGNITLRGNGITNVNVTGVLPGPSVVHFVYDSSVPAVRTYVNGVFQSSVPQVAFNFNATVPFKVGSYGTASSIPVGAMIDEFRFYSRALTANEISGTWNRTLPASIIRVNLSVIPEGLYNPLINQLSRRDTFSVYLRNASSPFSKVDSAKAVIDSLNFSGLCNFNNAPSGTYYIVVNHFNSIETWSKTGGENLVTDSSIYNYDFTGAITQAFGNNLKLEGSKYTIYSGDVNQDGIVDGADLNRIDNDVFSFVSGIRIPTDLDGNSVVDGSDYAIGDNNGFNFVSVIRP